MSMKKAIENRIKIYQEQHDKAVKEGDTKYANILKGRIEKFKSQLARI